MSRMYLWNAFMSLCGIGAGAVIFKLGSAPLSELHFLKLSIENEIIYGVIMTVGLIIMVQCSSSFSRNFWSFIGSLISAAWNRRKARKRREAMFANATPISEPLSAGWSPEAPSRFAQTSPVVSEAATPAFTLSPPS